MIKETGLEKGNLTLDALHCNPATTEQINQANGSYLIQLKENQAQWLKHCKNIYTEGSVVASNKNIQQQHRRLTTHLGSACNIDDQQLDGRWKSSGIKTLVVIERDTISMSTQKESHETSYYICNQKMNASPLHTSHE